MNHLRIEYLETSQLTAARFIIDDMSLIDVVGQHQRIIAPHDGPHGAYEPIQDIFWGDECYFIRNTAPGDFLHKDGAALVLECECHEWGCWNLFCKILVLDKKVIWSDFFMHHREWKHKLYFEFPITEYRTQFKNAITFFEHKYSSSRHGY